MKRIKPLAFFRKTGREGGLARVKNNSKKELSNWGRLGGLSHRRYTPCVHPRTNKRMAQHFWKEHKRGGIRCSICKKRRSDCLILKRGNHHDVAA